MPLVPDRGGHVVREDDSCDGAALVAMGAWFGHSVRARVVPLRAGRRLPSGFRSVTGRWLAGGGAVKRRAPLERGDAFAQSRVACWIAVVRRNSLRPHSRMALTDALRRLRGRETPADRRRPWHGRLDPRVSTTPSRVHCFDCQHGRPVPRGVRPPSGPRSVGPGWPPCA